MGVFDAVDLRGIDIERAHSPAMEVFLGSTGKVRISKEQLSRAAAL
jgi:hypothetical protein